MLPSQGVFCMEIIVASLRKQVDTPLSYRYKSHSIASSSTDWTRT